MTGTLLALLSIFSRMSLLAVGGTAIVLPEMQREVVDVHGWMTAREFASLFALAQAAPGPNMMISTLIGLHVAGISGALVATFGMVAPATILAVVTAGLWHRFRDAAWRRIVQAAIVPLTIGLVAAAAVLIARSADSNVALAGITVVAAALLLGTRLHPLWVLAAGALLGVLGAG
jgi:chromate transporter